VANPQVILSLSAEDNLTATLKHAQDELKNFAAANKQLEAQLRKYDSANDKVNTTINQGTASLRGYRSGMAQLGYQIQDIAVQVQGGQNLGIILGQQGSQIASVFGPSGVVAGAILSIGALIGTALVPRLFEADKTTEDLVEETLKYTDQLQFATEAQREFVESFRAEKLEEQRERLAELTAELKIMADAQVALDDILNEGRAGNYYMGASAAARTFTGVLKDQNETLVEQQNLLAQLGESNAQAARMMEETNFENEQRLEEDRWKAYQKRLEKQRKADEKAAQDKIALEQLIYDTEQGIRKQAEARDLAAAQEAIRVEQVVYDALAGFRTKEKEDKEAYDAWYRGQLQKQLQADVEHYMKVRELSEAVTGNLASAAGALALNLKEGTRAQQAALAVQKGLAVGQAIMNMHVAISEANKLPFPANISLVARAAATGLSAIAGVQAVSFEGGGYTGMGIRAGGLDGRGGMPAIVHPNETIIDHSKGQGMGGVSVNFTIQANDTTGFDRLLQQRKGLIVSMINQAVNNRGRASLA
jgi:hypothetical protein